MLSPSSTPIIRVVAEDSSLDSQISARETLSGKKVVDNHRYLFYKNNHLNSRILRRARNGIPGFLVNIQLPGHSRRSFFLQK